jgi:4-hydroxyacetophenone monooxygenase
VTRSFHVGQSFSTPTADTAAALELVSIPTLLLSLVHLTGDRRYIRDFKQAGLFLNEVQGFMSEEDKARARALPVIADYRDGGCPVPIPLPDELVRSPIETITPTGVVTTDGVAHDADIILYATGFRATDVLFP